MLYRGAIESFFNTKNREAAAQHEKIKAASEGLKDQMILGNADQKYKALESVLDLALESDGRSIEYFSTFHSILGMALQYSKLFSERVNVDMKHTKLLKRALNEIVEEANNSRGSCSYNYPNHINSFLGSSEDERTVPDRRLTYVEIDTERYARKAARHNYADNECDSISTDDTRVGVVYNTEHFATHVVVSAPAPFADYKRNQLARDDRFPTFNTRIPQPVARSVDNLFCDSAPCHAADNESSYLGGVSYYSNSPAAAPAAAPAAFPPSLPEK